MALMAPLGAKGQDYTGLTVRQARNHAGDNHSVQFTGYVAHFVDNGPNSTASLFVQDNDLDGAGIEVFASHSLVANVQTGYKISVTATKVLAIPSDYGNSGSVIVESLDVTSVTVLATNTLPSVITPSLQGMKDMHYPATSIPKIIADPFQSRLVRLNWLKVVQHLQNSHFHGWVVEDLNGVRDTLSLYDIYPQPTLTVGTMYKRVVAVNTRCSDNSLGGYNKLRVRSMNDLEEANLVTMQEARQLATQSNQTGTEVSVIGVVSFARFGDWNSGEIYMQTPNGGSGYGGMKVVTVGDPASRGITTGTKIIVTGTPRVINTDGYPYGPGHNNAPDMVAMMNVDVTSITVISQDAPYSFGNKTLADLRQNNPTISNVKNNTYQHNMVKLNNLTVVQHLDDKTYHGETYHYYEVSQGSGNNTVTDVLLSRDELAQNMVLPSVKVVNCRSNMLDTYHYDSNLGLSGDNHPNHLLLRSLDDIDYNTVTINYARIHLNQWHYIQGVVSYAYYVGGHPDNAQWVFVQDDTGGLFCEVYDEQHFLEVGDKVILKVYPTRQGQAVNIISELSYTEIASILDHNQSITPINLDMSAIYQQGVWFNNPGGNVVFQRLIRLQNLEIVGKDRPGDTFVLDVIESGNQSQHLSLELSAYSQNIHLTPSAFIDFYNSIEIGSVISSVTGVFDCRSNTYRPIFLRNPDDIEIQNPEPRNISFSLYPYELEDLPESPVYATLTPNGTYANRITSATPGTRVYIHTGQVDNNIADIDYFNPKNYSPNVNPQGQNDLLYCHRMICHEHPELSCSQGFMHYDPLSFIMPNDDVEFEGIYVSVGSFGADPSLSDVWQAREGAKAEANDPTKLAYFKGLVTFVLDPHNFIMQDVGNHYTDEELKMNNGILVSGYSLTPVAVGDVVFVSGHPNGLFDDYIYLTGPAIIDNYGPSDNTIEHPYATTLAGIYNDLHGSGQTLFNSRLQTRLVQLNDLYVVANLGNNQYRVRQTINNNSKEAILKVPASVSLSEGSYLGVIALNWSAADSQDIELILRSEADITGANDITISTYAMSFDEFGSGLNSSGSAYLWVNVPISIGSNLADMVQVGSANVSYTGNWIYDGTNATIEPLITYGKTSLRFCVPANSTTETRTCAITIHAGSITSQPLVITQTGCGPAEFTVSPDFQSFGPVDPNYSSKGLYSQTGYINITDISHVAQPYGSHITTSVASAYTGQNTDWFSLGAWDAENQRFPFTIANNNEPSSVTRGVNVAIIMEGTDGTLVQHEAAVHQSGPGASVTVTPNWWSAEAPLCQQVTKTFEVNYTNFNLAVNPARVWLEASDFNDDDVEVSIEPSPASPVELTEAAGTIYYQVTFLVKNAGSHYGTFKARVQEQDIGDWWDSFDSQEASVWVSGLHPGNIDTKATSIETLNSLAIPTWNVLDPNTYETAYTIDMIRVSIASESLNLQAEMVTPESYVSCTTFTQTFVDGTSTLIPLSDGTYIIKVGGNNLAWNSTDGLYEEHIQFPSYTTDLFEVPASCKWNISFSGENAVISPSTNPNYSLRMVSVMVPNPENPEETILDYRIVCINEGGTPLQIFYHKEGELASPTFSEATPYFYEGQSVTVTLTPAENTTLAYTLEEDYDNPVTSNVPVTLTFTETTKVIAWSMLECQTYSLDGLVEHTYYNINTIAEARANANMECYIHGIVSSADHVHNRYFVQDETSGVEIGIDWTIWENVYNNHDSLVALQNGDEIVLKGWCDEYGMFTGATYDWNSSTTYDEPEVAKLSTGNTVAPLIVTFDDLYETTDAQYLGRLVKLENEQVTVWAGNPETYQLRHGTPEEPYYLEFPRYMENEDTQFSLNDGDLIDLTAVYVNGGFNNPKEIVKGISLTVEGYGNSTNAKWAFIASPVEGSVMPVEVDNLFCNEFDLYRFDQNQDAEWRNYKAGSFNLANGQGYLYATEEDVTLIFKGDFFDGDSKTVSLNYSDGNEFSGWNLVGNPFATAARANRSYYKMNAEGTAIEAVSAYSTTNIAPCTGVMVQAEGSNENVTFTRATQQSAPNQGLLNITLNQANTRGNAMMDNAIVSFNDNDRLNKFSFGESDATLCIPQGGKDCAIAFAQRQGEMLLNFKAAKNGTYTLNFSSQEVSFSYLHLVDNLTGADIDLLHPETVIAGEDPQSLVPSYTFEAKTTDYASRFRLVFSSNCGDAVVDNEAFAFIDASGNIVINGIVGDAGTASLQVIDMTGRVILRRDVLNASQTIPTGGMAPGVYMMRLINGEKVMVQKIVVR